MATALGFPAEDLKEANVAEWKELVGRVRCLRCGGLMVPEQCFDLLSDSGHLDFLARRCVQCGDLVDPIILRNRRLRTLGDFGKTERG
jgi:hypothetical protein